MALFNKNILGRFPLQAIGILVLPRAVNFTDYAPAVVELPQHVDAVHMTLVQRIGQLNLEHRRRHKSQLDNYAANHRFATIFRFSIGMGKSCASTPDTTASISLALRVFKQVFSRYE